MTKRILIFALLPVLLAGGCENDVSGPILTGLIGGDTGSNGPAPIIGGDKPRRPLRDVISPLFGAPGQPLAGAGFFDALVVNDSSSAATATLQFFLLKRLVHETVLRNLAPGTTTLIAGPERATHLIANSVSATGLHYPEGRFVFGVDVDGQTPAVYRIEDPVIEPPPPVPDADTPATPDEEPPPEDVDTTGVEGGGTGGESPPPPDCNSNGIDDREEVAQGSAPDCNTDGIPDDCQLDPDCNEDGIPDECQLDPDCNTDGIPDDCQLDSDCNTDGIPDECQLDPDCNSNGMPDECDIAAGTSSDRNANGIPDECEVLCPFVDDFDRPDSGTIGFPEEFGPAYTWDELESEGADPRDNSVVFVDSNSVVLRGFLINGGDDPDAALTQTELEVSGLAVVTLSYTWEVVGETEWQPEYERDRLEVSWRASDEGEWIIITRHELESHRGDPYYVPEENRPSVAAFELGVDSVASIDLRFSLFASEADEGVRLDNVEVCPSDPRASGRRGW